MALDGCKSSVSCHECFTARERAPQICKTEGWVSPTASLDILEKRKMPAPEGGVEWLLACPPCGLVIILTITSYTGCCFGIYIPTPCRGLLPLFSGRKDTYNLCPSDKYLPHSTLHSRRLPPSPLIEFGFLHSARRKSWNKTNMLWSLQQQERAVVGVRVDRAAAPVRLVSLHPRVTHHSRMLQMTSEYSQIKGRK
jgi:hypothetical protein